MHSLIHLLALASLNLQAGGGGSFGSGGGGFGGGSGDGDGIGYLFYFLIRLAFEVPIIGIPLLIVAIFIFVKGAGKGASSNRRRVIRRHLPQVHRTRSRDVAQTVREADGSFDEAAFLSRVGSAFVKIQKSWCAQDLLPLQHFVSDGVYERFSLQVAEQQADGWRQGMDGLTVGQVSMAHFESGRSFDTLVVRIEFEADIHRLSLVSGERLPGSRIPRSQFAECWSFVRRSGAHSVASKGLMEGQCPNCGAPLALNQAARCETCEAHIRSGEFDWVLTEITQASEWRPEPEAAIPGFEAHVQADPGLSVQLLEDRASVAFWRRAAADRAGDAGPLARVGTEDYVRGYQETIGALPGRDRFFIAENAVGSVRTIGILAGKEFDRAIVEILYDGCRAQVEADGSLRVGTSRYLQRALFVFRRAAGRSTNLKETFTTTLCRTCGAHDVGGLDPLCPYCDAPRTGDRDAWLLDEVVVDRTPAAHDLRRELEQAARPESATRPVASESAADLLTWAAHLARADGTISGKERLGLQNLGERIGVSPARLEEMLEEGGDGSAIPEPRDTLEARSWLRDLIRITLEDGVCSTRERRLLQQTAKHFGIGSREFARLMRQEEKGLARDSRRAGRDPS